MSPEFLLRHFDDATLWPPDARSHAPDDLGLAYQTALLLRDFREARGERVVGYKIGFTNRTIWPIYHVYAPIWGPVWDTTLTRCDGVGALDLARTCQPRLEPEVAFRLRATPPPDCTLDQLFGCVDGLAPAFEVVQSHAPDWVFTAAETVADGALHARLLVGRMTPVHELAASGAALDERLAACEVRLYRDDEWVARGLGVNVLDGPLHALLHFVHEHQRCPGAAPLQAGDVVTTGTWTDAWPIAPGQRWRAEFDAPLSALEVMMR